MKKTRINLLTSKQDYYRLENYFALFRKFLIGYCLVLFLIVLGLASYRIFQTIQINNLNQTKKEILLQLASRQTDEVKLIKLSKKLNSLHKFMKDDAKFIPYYELLLTTLGSSSQSATLQEFNIDKSRAMNFKLRFNNFDEMVSAFQFIESRAFGKNFEKLDMIDFIGKGGELAGVTYELSFEGVFKPINAAQN